MKASAYVTSSRKAWEDILDKSSQATPFHSWEWLEVLEKCYPWNCVRLVLECDNRPVGVFPFALVPLGNRGIFHIAHSLPPEEFCGPAFIDDADERSRQEVASRLMDETTISLGKNWRILGVSASLSPLNYQTPLGQAHWRRLGYEITRYGDDYATSLVQRSPAIWDEYSKECRWSVRKAIERRVTTLEVKDQRLLPECHALYAESMAHAREPATYPLTTFYETFNILNDKAEFYLAEWNDQRIGTAIVLSNSNMAFYWIGGIAREKHYMRVYPLHLLLHNAIEKAKERGVRLFGLGKAPTKGLRMFKGSWGSQRFETYTVRKYSRAAHVGLRVVPKRIKLRLMGIRS